MMMMETSLSSVALPTRRRRRKVNNDDDSHEIRQENEEENNNHGDEDDDDEEEEEEDYVHCFLNVTPVMYAKDGYVCVAVGTFVRAKNANMDARNLYVYPQDIKLPRDLEDWEGALPHIVV